GSASTACWPQIICAGADRLRPGDCGILRLVEDDTRAGSAEADLRDHGFAAFGRVTDGCGLKLLGGAFDLRGRLDVRVAETERDLVRAQADAIVARLEVGALHHGRLRKNDPERRAGGWHGACERHDQCQKCESYEE